MFIHERACKPFDPSDRYPDELRSLPLTFNAYGQGRRLLAQLRIEDGRVEEAVAPLFEDARLAYLYVRNTEAGCFVAWVERAGGRGVE